MISHKLRKGVIEIRKTEHIIPYIVHDLVTSKVIFITLDKNEVSKFLNIGENWWKNNRHKNKVYKSRYYIAKNSDYLPEISQKDRIKIMLRSFGMIETDLEKPSIYDIELMSNVCKSYGILEDEFWGLINRKFKKIRVEE